MQILLIYNIYMTCGTSVNMLYNNNNNKIKKMDLRFKTPFTLLLAGSSSSGKTTWVFKLIDNLDNISNNKINKIIYYYQNWQNVFQSYVSAIDFKEGTPSSDDFISDTNNVNALVIIDDALTKGIVDNSISNIYTRLSHHQNASVILISQNLFIDNKNYRSISNNSMYLVLMKNPRNLAVISALSRQICPGQSRELVNIYKEATKESYSYLLIDNHQISSDLVRIRSNIFFEDGPMKIWALQKNL